MSTIDEDIEFADQVYAEALESREIVWAIELVAKRLADEVRRLRAEAEQPRKLCTGCGLRPLSEFDAVGDPAFKTRDGLLSCCRSCNEGKRKLVKDEAGRVELAPEWPPEDRIDAIGQNGNDGLHYEGCKPA